MKTSEIPPLEFHEVDGAQSNVRLNSYLLSLPQFKGSHRGMFFEHSRCQNHSTHLVTVCMLALAGCNLLSKLYQLAAFLGNLGYVLRLQLAVADWLQEKLIIKPMADRQPDPLMEELCDYLKYWHKHGNLSESEGSHPRAETAFEKNLQLSGTCGMVLPLATRCIIVIANFPAPATATVCPGATLSRR